MARKRVTEKDARRMLKEMKSKGVSVKELKDKAYALDHSHDVAAADYLNEAADKLAADMRSKGWDPTTHVRSGR